MSHGRVLGWRHLKHILNELFFFFFSPHILLTSNPTRRMEHHQNPLYLLCFICIYVGEGKKRWHSLESDVTFKPTNQICLTELLPKPSLCSSLKMPPGSDKTSALAAAVVPNQ